MGKRKSPAAGILMVFLLTTLLYPETNRAQEMGALPLIHGVKWNMGMKEVQAAERAVKSSSLIDDFEMDNEITVSYRSFFEREGGSNRWPVNITYFLFDGKLYSILCNFISTNEEAVLTNFHDAIDHYRGFYGPPKLSDGFRNITAWETNGTVLTIMLGVTYMNAKKTVFSIQFDSPDAQDVRLKLDRIRNAQFLEKEILKNE